MYSQATVSPALMHSLGLPSGLPWLKVSRARVIGSLKRAESSPPLGCSPGKHGTLSCLQGRVERILTQTAPVSLVLAGGRRNQAGDSNLAGDAASRSEFDRLRALAAALKVRLARLPMPAVCESIYHDVLAFARSRGQRIATSRRPPEPMMPPSGRSFLEHLEMHLGGAFSSRVEKDGPKTVADKLRARAQAGAPDTPIERRGSSTVAAKLQQRSALPPHRR